MQWATPSPKCTPRKSATTSGIIATGHYDRPNQTNNELTFPGVFKRALDVRAHTINEEMSSPPAHAIATAIRDDELLPKQIIPSVVNCQVAESVAHAVADAAISGVARRERRTGAHYRSSGQTSRH